MGVVSPAKMVSQPCAFWPALWFIASSASQCLAHFLSTNRVEVLSIHIQFVSQHFSGVLAWWSRPSFTIARQATNFHDSPWSREMILRIGRSTNFFLFDLGAVYMF
jgi:hypothetical protein